VLALLRRFPARFWGDARIAAAAALAVAVLLWATDNLLNAMVTPLPQAFAGAIVSFGLLPREVRRRRPSAVLARRVAPPRRGASAA
jgi:hypothetical protein